MRCSLIAGAILLLSPPALQAQFSDTLDIYWIDVEGGAATLIVTPSQETILMDAGWARVDERDAKRIQAALEDANVTKVDYFITSHFHGDHVGGVPALADRVAIGQFLDHGDIMPADLRAAAPPLVRQMWESYLAAAGDRRRSVKPGDKLPLTGVEFTFVASRGEVIPEPFEPQAPNPHCQGASVPEVDRGENGNSVGYLLSLGGFQFLNLGDLTGSVEHELACPENRLGAVDVYQVPHHGGRIGGSVTPQLTWALTPTVAIVNNGPRKGGDPDGYEVIEKIPGVEGIWQVHRAMGTDAAHNTDPRLIANLTEEDDCQGYWLKAMVHPDGRSYTIINGRTGLSRTYISK